jgi:hypothetical protein
LSYLFCSHNFHKILNYFNFEHLTGKVQCRKNLNKLTKNLRVFNPKHCYLSLRIWGPRPKIRDPEKTYPGSRIQGSKKHRIPDPQRWLDEVRKQ